MNYIYIWNTHRQTEPLWQQSVSNDWIANRCSTSTHVHSNWSCQNSKHNTTESFYKGILTWKQLERENASAKIWKSHHQTIDITRLQNATAEKTHVKSHLAAARWLRGATAGFQNTAAAIWTYEASTTLQNTAASERSQSHLAVRMRGIFDVVPMSRVPEGCKRHLQNTIAWE